MPVFGLLNEKRLNWLRLLIRLPLRSRLRTAHFNKKARFAGNALFSEFAVRESRVLRENPRYGFKTV